MKDDGANQPINVFNMPNIDLDIKNISNKKYDFSNKDNQFYYNPSNIVNDTPVIDKKSISILIYTINLGGNIPFLEFLLYKTYNNNPKDDICILPFFKVKHKKKVLDEADNYIKDVFIEWKIKPNYKGYINYNKKTYLIYEKLYETSLIPLIERKDKWWWVLPCEIINNKMILNFPIHSEAQAFFLHNKELNYLYDNNKIPYESPVIYYHASDYKSIIYMSIFGIRKSSPKSRFGPYYYYTIYNRALRHAVWSIDGKPSSIDDELITINKYGKLKQGGLIRFVLFPGKMKVLLNRETDIADDSALSIEKSKKDLFVKNTLKLRDLNGNWANNYNSIFTGKHIITGNNKKEYIHYPHIVMQSYTQQYPLSYYYIDTASAPAERVRELNLYIN
jgi:hypothetical protein